MNSKAPLEIVPARVAASLGELPTNVLKVARLCDGSRNLEALCAVSQMAADEVTPILQRLVALGVVRESSVRKRRALSEKALAWAHGKSQSAFSDDEELFFASPVPAEE